MNKLPNFNLKFARDKPIVVIETHGCKLNQADTLVLESEFEGAGFRVVPDSSLADVYVVNTCTVTHIADRKGRQSLRAARRRNKDSLVVATGCYAERSPDILNGLTGIDMVVGNEEKTRLVERVIEWMQQFSPPNVPISDLSSVGKTPSRTRAMVKIQEGCDQVCAYCIVPKVRGRERSIPPDDVIRMINEYVSRGYKEVVLTGTQLGTYGFDIPDTTLSDLLTRILSESSLPRLRVSSLQPQEISDSLLGIWKNPRMCPHFHLALQSGSADVLVRMRRRYTVSQYRRTVQLIRENVPEASITTDVIVGFPGETYSEFMETYKLCEEMEFAAIHVFPYSQRPGTSSAYFANQVDSSDKTIRVKRLISVGDRCSDMFRERLLGSIRPVLWEEKRRDLDGRGNWFGLTDNYIRVVTESPVTLGNKITPVHLFELRDGMVAGSVI